MVWNLHHNVRSYLLKVVLMKEVVIVAIARTPIGSFQGALSTVPAVRLGAEAIRGAVAGCGIAPHEIDEVIMGHVLSAGAGQAPARQAALGAGLPNSVPCTAVNKVCGSGLKAVMLGRQAIATGAANIVVAGGMESMSLAPYLLPNARAGYRMGSQQVVDAMLHDGLWDPFGNSAMGNYGDLCARENGYSREAQDAYALQSYQRALDATAAGQFKDEIVPVEVTIKGKTHVVDCDEEPQRFKPEKIPQLRPAFSDNGTVTAANASKISDGAAALVLMSRDEAARRRCTVLAHIVSDASFAHQPQWFTTAPAHAIRRALEKADLTPDKVDLYEINEAFAVVTMAAIDQLELDVQSVNIHGGAISLGHPIGCSGARVLVTLVNALRGQGKQYGCAALCIGGGEAVSMIVENATQ